MLTCFQLRNLLYNESYRVNNYTPHPIYKTGMQLWTCQVNIVYLILDIIMEKYTSNNIEYSLQLSTIENFDCDSLFLRLKNMINPFFYMST